MFFRYICEICREINVLLWYWVAVAFRILRKLWTFRLIVFAVNSLVWVRNFGKDFCWYYDLIWFYITFFKLKGGIGQIRKKNIFLYEFLNFKVCGKYEMETCKISDVNNRIRVMLILFFVECPSFFLRFVPYEMLKILEISASNIYCVSSKHNTKIKYKYLCDTYSILNAKLIHFKAILICFFIQIEV